MQVVTSLNDEYYKTSFEYYKYQFIFCLLFKILPMTYYFIFDDKSMIPLYIALIGNLQQLFFELIQMRILKDQYFLQFWNIVDVIDILSFFILFSFRLRDSEIGTIEIYLRTIIIVVMMLKINFYLRIFKKIGMLVTLIETCLKDIVPFMIYLIIW